MEVYKLSYNSKTMVFTVLYKVSEYADLSDDTKKDLTGSGYTLTTEFYADITHPGVYKTNPRMAKTINNFIEKEKLKDKIKKFLDE